MTNTFLEDGFRLASKLPRLAERLAEQLSKSGVTCVRPDFMPLAIPLYGHPLERLTLTAPGWGKLNFESLKLMRFDADLGLVDLAPFYRPTDESNTDRNGLSGKSVLSKWQKHPSWSIETDRATPLSHLVFMNRSDSRGDRSAALTMAEPALHTASGKMAPKAKPFFRMNDADFLARQTIAAANEIAVIAIGLMNRLSEEPSSSYAGVKLEIATNNLAAHSHARESNDEVIGSILHKIATIAATILCGELRKRVPPDDWAFNTPPACFSLLLSRDVVAGNFTDETPIRLTISISNAEAETSDVSLMFGGSLPKAAGLMITPVAPEAPLYQHRWLVTVPAGTTINRVVVERTEAGKWPHPASQISIRDAGRSASMAEINPVAAALTMLRLCGQVSGHPRNEPFPMLAAYCFTWRLFLENSFGRLRSFWQSKMMQGLVFSDLSSAVTDYNANLPPQHHRILSKHGFKKPLYAQNIPAIMRQISLLEQMIHTETGEKLFICYGTLLGCVRDSAFIPHDDDVDVAWVSDVTDFEDMLAQRKKLLERLRTYANVLVDDPHTTRLNCTVKMVKSGTPVNLDLFPIWRTPDGRVHGMMERLKVRPMKEDWFRDFKRITFYDSLVWVPIQAEGFLQDRYGSGWTVSDPSYGLG